MKIAVVTNLFPDSSRPGLAPFNRQQFIHLAREHELHVVSPVPWLHRMRLALSGRSPVPLKDCGRVMRVEYPTSYYTPKIMRSLYGRFYYMSIAGTMRRLVRRVLPDMIYATWAYPDCFAAVLAGERHGLPVVSRVHGSDINEYFRHPPRKRLILSALRRSKSIIAVSGDLKVRLVSEGIDEGKVHVIYNGIDRDIFHPVASFSARTKLGLSEHVKIVLYAGNLEPVKAVGLLIEAMSRLGKYDAELHILGSGPEYRRLVRLTGSAGLEGRVIFHGSVEHTRMGMWFNACDLFCLPSLDEGTPNVILEALACRTPVVATDTGGIPEILSSESGILFRRGDVDGLAGALNRGLAREWDVEKITCPAGSWGDNAREVGELFAGIVESSKR